jgi:hypothetical protein
MNSCFQKYLRTWLLPVVLSLFSVAQAQDSIAIGRSGRNIQLDGFLMDWVAKNKHGWNGSSTWTWDAVATPEGVAGYFHAGAPACSTWTFFLGGLGIKMGQMQLSTAQGAERSFYRVNHSIRDSAQGLAITVEWLVPWDSLSIDNAGRFAIELSGNSACKESLKPLLLAGSVAKVKPRLPQRLIFQIGIIGMLLVWYVMLQLRIRKRTRRKV